jgi:outer membrane protein
MNQIKLQIVLQLSVLCFLWGWPLNGWSGEPLTLTIEQALVMALEHNRSLVVERLNPMVQKTYVEQEQSAFDPLVLGSASIERADGERQTTTGLQDVTTETSKAGVSLQKLFSTGTVAELSIDSQTTDSSLYPDPLNQTTLGLSINQPLLRGMGRQTQLIRLQQARIETDMSQYELRGFSENLVAQVENAYWDYGLARRQIEIVEESLKLAEQQLSETREMITVGVTAESELAAGQAEVAAQRQGLINSRSALGTSRLRLLRLLNPPGEPFWDRDIGPPAATSRGQPPPGGTACGAGFEDEAGNEPGQIRTATRRTGTGSHQERVAAPSGCLYFLGKKCLCSEF